MKAQAIHSIIRRARKALRTPFRVIYGRPTLRFRPATMDDCDLLRRWRNDPQTRRASLDTTEVAPDTHCQWLRQSLSRTDRKLLIAESDGRPVGTVRLDFTGRGSELSWTVAPEARGRGVGKAMVSAIIDETDGAVVARIRAENAASLAIARAAGMALFGEENGITHWRIETRALRKRRAGR